MCLGRGGDRGGKARGTYSSELRPRTFKTSIERARNDCYDCTIRGLFRHSCWNCRRLQRQCSIQGNTFDEHRQQHSGSLGLFCNGNACRNSDGVVFQFAAGAAVYLRCGDGNNVAGAREVSGTTKSRNRIVEPSASQSLPTDLNEYRNELRHPS